MKRLILQNGQLVEEKTPLWQTLSIYGWFTGNASRQSEQTARLSLSNSTQYANYIDLLSISATGVNAPAYGLDFANLPSYRFWFRINPIISTLVVATYLGGSRAETTTTTLTSLGVGIEFRERRLWLVSHNGTTLSEQDTGYDLANAVGTNTNWHHCELHPQNGALRVLIDGTTVSTMTGIPTSGVSTYSKLSFHGRHSNASGDATTNDFWGTEIGFWL